MSKQSPLQPSCPFCRSNDLLEGKVIAQTQTAYLIESTFGQDNYLIIPADHIESVQDLSDMWWKDVKAMLSKLPQKMDAYNISLNLGKDAGQTLTHLHLWVIPRKPDLPSSGKGLAGLIAEVNDGDN